MFSPSAFYAHFVLSQLFPLNSTILVISLKRKYESLPDVLKVAIWLILTVHYILNNKINL